MASIIFTYPVQRQIFPEMASFISANWGLGFCSRRLLVTKIMPGVQKPH